jgi:hypothetical protein
MSDRTNGQRKMNGDGDPTLRGSLDGVHATDEQLNAMLDGALEAAERAEVERHIDNCATCHTQLVELRGMTAMLRALPEPRLRRSFQLGPEHQRRYDSIWTKISSWLLPTLPALRAATVAVALLLAAVSIRNIVDDPAERGVVSDFSPSMQTSVPTEQPTESSSRNTAALQTNQRTAAPTVESDSVSQPEAEMSDGEEQVTSATEPTNQGYAPDAPAPDEGMSAESAQAPMADQSTGAAFAGGGTAPASAKSSGGDTSSSGADETGDADINETMLAPSGGDGESASMVTSADDNVAMVAAAPASPSPAPSPSATPLSPTATPTPTVTPTPSPSATPMPQPTATPSPVVVNASTRGGSIDGWETIQLILAVALVLLIVLLLVVRRIHVVRGTVAP